MMLGLARDIANLVRRVDGIDASIHGLNEQAKRYDHDLNGIKTEFTEIRQKLDSMIDDSKAGYERLERMLSRILFGRIWLVILFFLACGASWLPYFHSFVRFLAQIQ